MGWYPCPDCCGDCVTVPCSSYPLPRTMLAQIGVNYLHDCEFPISYNPAWQLPGVPGVTPAWIGQHPTNPDGLYAFLQCITSGTQAGAWQMGYGYGFGKPNIFACGTNWVVPTLYPFYAGTVVQDNFCSGPFPPHGPTCVAPMSGSSGWETGISVSANKADADTCVRLCCPGLPIGRTLCAAVQGGCLDGKTIRLFYQDSTIHPEAACWHYWTAYGTQPELIGCLEYYRHNYGAGGQSPCGNMFALLCAKGTRPDGTTYGEFNLTSSSGAFCDVVNRGATVTYQDYIRPVQITCKPFKLVFDAKLRNASNTTSGPCPTPDAPIVVTITECSAPPIVYPIFCPAGVPASPYLTWNLQAGTDTCGLDGFTMPMEYVPCGVETGVLHGCEFWFGEVLMQSGPLAGLYLSCQVAWSRTLGGVDVWEFFPRACAQPFYTGGANRPCSWSNVSGGYAGLVSCNPFQVVATGFTAASFPPTCPCGPMTGAPLYQLTLHQ